MPTYDAITVPPPLPEQPRGLFSGWTVREFIFLGVLWVAPLVAIAFQAQWYVWAGLYLAAAVTTTAIVQRHGGLELLGPHFFYDLLRLGRRGRSWDIRVIYAIFLLVGLGFVYWVRFPGQGLIDLFSTNAQMRPRR